MKLLDYLHNIIIGKPRNPLSPDTQRHIALIAFLAWIGLGADGLSSACYGPEESFLALGSHTSLALYLAIATGLTVFIISLAYNQVIELFPSGGGGYKVATQLLGRSAGLISGAALIVDYVLTIAISAASGTDQLFSLLPADFIKYKLFAECGMVITLIVLNLRGMKESIKFLLPIFLGFIVTHTAIILYGVFNHRSTLPAIINTTLQETSILKETVGWSFMLALLLRAYSMGSGTYTGIEAVSNNVNRLAEPRIRTGKWTMFYMATSLSFTAAGIILLYLLWNATPTPGSTLNAVVFSNILGPSIAGHFGLIILLFLEAGLLFVAANTGFLAGPSVLANMAIDNWVPNRFRHLSSRLVTQNGVLLFGFAALLILFFSEGKVSWLVVLYSINVFLTFSLSILGLCVYWWNHRRSKNWRWRLAFSIFALLITASILVVTLATKFTVGGWVTVAITGTVIAICLSIKRYYYRIAKRIKKIDLQLHPAVPPLPEKLLDLHPEQPTAVVFIGKSQGVAMHTLLWILRMFPGHFKNFVFVSTGIVDVESFRGQEAVEEMQHEVNAALDYFVSFCQQHHLAAKGVATFGTDPVPLLSDAAEKIIKEFPNTLFFASKLVFENENWITRFLHNETASTLQRRLHLQNLQVVLLPVKIA